MDKIKSETTINRVLFFNKVSPEGQKFCNPNDEIIDFRRNHIEPTYQSLLKFLRNASKPYEALIFNDIVDLAILCDSSENFFYRIAELTQFVSSIIFIGNNISTDSNAKIFCKDVVKQLDGHAAEIRSGRIKRGLVEAKRHGKALGRPQKVDTNVVLNLRKQGHSIRQIAKEVGVSPSTITNAIKRDTRP